MGMPVHLNNRCTCVSWDLSRFVLQKKRNWNSQKKKNHPKQTAQHTSIREGQTSMNSSHAHVSSSPAAVPSPWLCPLCSWAETSSQLICIPHAPHHITHCCLASASACVWLRTLSQRTLWQAEAAYDRVHHNHSRNYNHRCLAQLAHNKVNGHSPQTSSLEPKHTNAVQRQRTVH